jgi:hypothetical protein
MEDRLQVSVSTVASLNTQAVELMQLGDSIQAHASLIRALRELQLLLSSTEVEANDSTNSSTSANANESSISNEHTTGTASIGANTRPEVIDEVSNNICYSVSPTEQDVNESIDSDLYARAFHITESPSPTNAWQPPLEFLALGAILLYNLALIHHQAGIATGKSKDLKTALQLYQQSSRQLQIVGAESTASSELEYLVLMAAVLHNEHQIHTFHFDTTAMHTTELHLTEVVRQMEQVFQRDNHEHHIMQAPRVRDLHFFSLSLALARMRAHRCAPAA